MHLTKRQRTLALAAYTAIFFALWTAHVLWVYPWSESLGKDTAAYCGVSLGVRLLIWVLPAFLYVRLVLREPPVAYLRLKEHWLRGIIVGIGLGAMYFISAVIERGFHYRADVITWNSVLNTATLIGFIEETPFRGLIMRELMVLLPAWLAIVLSALLFVGIHVPGWLTLHLWNPRDAAVVFVMGCVLGVAVHKTRSLWAGIVAHSINDAAFLFTR